MNMDIMHEDILDRSVDPLKIGTGESVGVFTLMGNHVMSGEVIASTVNGVSVKGEDGSAYFNASYYLYLPKNECGHRDAILPARDVIDEGEDDGEKEDDADLSGDKDDDKEEKKKEKKKAEKDKKDKVDKKDDGGNGEIKPDRLPDDIKSKVIKVDDLDDGEVDRILSLIGDTAVSALKDAKIRQADLFDIVSRIQKAILKELKPGGDNE